jgi:glycosyltransferase involved in cell wall biosynthesis
MAKPFRVVALVSAYNEGDIIASVLEHLIENGVDVYLLDNHSTDDTVEQARPWLGRGLLKIESFPDGPDAQTDRFDWRAILRRKERLAQELDADWFIHHDADEVRESPWPKVSLRDAIQWVDTLDYNCIDFRVLTFRPVDDGFRRGLDPRSYFTYFEEGAEFDKLQRKCWKARLAPISLALGGHDVRFADRRVFPLPFLLRHYPIRGQEHGRRKVFLERKPRFVDEERSKGWHVQYDHVRDDTHCFLGDVESLSVYDGDRVRLGLMLDNDAGPRSTEMREELDRTRAERESLAKALQATQEAHAALEQALHTQATAGAESAAELERTRQEHDGISADLAQKIAERDALEKELSAKTSELSRGQAEISKARGERDQTASDLSQQSAERHRLEQALLRMLDRGSRNGKRVAVTHSNGNGAVPPYGPDAEQDTAAYHLWLRNQEAAAPAERRRLDDALAAAAALPRLSVIIPVFHPQPEGFERAIESVRQQVYGGWQVCLCDDGSGDERLARRLDELRGDPRFRVVVHGSNAGISAASNSALGVADGDFVCFLDQDDELHPEALAELALAVASDPEVDLLYTDEDKIDENGVRCEPFFKPDWSPDTLLSHMYVGHLLAARRDLVERAGGLRSSFDGSQDYDLALRLSEEARRIRHIPKVLYHWRKSEGSTARHYFAKPGADQAARAALRSALVRRGEHAEVLDGFVESTFRVRRRIRRNPRVSVIIPFRDGADLLQRCVDSLRTHAGYDHWEAILVDNQSWQPETKAFLRSVVADERVRLLEYDAPFNFSALNNWAVKQADGDQLLFLNSDIEGGSSRWLEAMVEHGERPEVGAVGARLLYPNGHVQHAGLIMGILGIAGHAFRFCPGDAVGYFSQGKIIRNCSGVTAACMLVRRKVFDEVGGFDETLRVAFNDVDFCLRLRQKEYTIVWTPYADLVHHESMSRGSANDRGEIITMLRRWGERLSIDPYFNPNFSRRREDFVLPPMPEEPPWKQLRSALGI